MFTRTISCFALFMSLGLAEASTSPKKEKMMGYQIETLQTKAQPALVIKGKAKVEEVGEAIGTILGKIGKYLGETKHQPKGAPFTRTFQFKDGIIEFEAGFPVEKKVAPRGEIITTELPSAQVVTTTHIGPQETTERAYEALHAWMNKNKKKEGGAPWEVYLTDSEKTPSDQAKTQIYFPIR